MAGNDEAVGRTGVLTLPTRGAAGPGEVRLRVAGGDETYFAWSPEPLPPGTAVLVVESRGDAHLDVVPWLEPPV